MKIRFFSESILALLILVVFTGCVTPTPPCNDEAPPQPIPITPLNLTPLTVPILQQIFNDNNGHKDNALNKMQLYLSEEITLERAQLDSSFSLDKNGKVQIRLADRPDIRILDDALMGVGKNIRGAGEKIFLSVLFQKDDQNRLLSFSNFGDHRDQYFYLDWTPHRESKISNYRGLTSYDLGEPYLVSFKGERTPYLLINLSKEVDKNPQVTNETGLTVKEYNEMLRTR